ncbi:Dinucleotide-utilizing enzyme possibly involved in molybdopterin or thiamin biosynthesis [Mesorhizobium prunaredense]|uniref:Dinucleotide-utilizing enzyme possibly involved in molybdopterin or thiamin biosynthesis n=1 Tax=Mesorhizobium prunaredense TaxID=1631249 RepID=A0A1R3V8J7_9HYPH|nr:ThiF family adenylyltransferase [Mesorhizobium prunaredense]SIT56154.1 Dinucleotide-utilizing enzyme possibly involved in molybdopterin or thiamin biosynthesis [Mesorhizobium prunaredense]
MNWLDRQSFLGPHSEGRLAEVTIGLVGLGGGNSHVAQQLAHLGIGNFVLADGDRISLTNLNRLIGGTWWNVLKRTAKVEIMRRMIKAINPRAHVEIHRKQWQLAGDAFKRCDIIVGGLDNLRGKDELDAFCRRFLIPYLDQGMDVHKLQTGDGHLVAGQVVLSQPGSPCLRCLGIVSEAALAEEAGRYGAAGGRPQVVWSNGVLASLAVGLVVQLVTPWNRRDKAGAYLSFDANTGLITEAERFRRWSASCPHYPLTAVGDPGFDIRKFTDRITTSDHRPSRWRRLLSTVLRKLVAVGR